MVASSHSIRAEPQGRSPATQHRDAAPGADPEQLSPGRIHPQTIRCHPFNGRCRVDATTKACNSRCRITTPTAHTQLNRQPRSAYEWSFTLCRSVTSSRSAAQRANNRGPRTEPCGTEHATQTTEDILPLYDSTRPERIRLLNAMKTMHEAKATPRRPHRRPSPPRRCKSSYISSYL